MMNKYIHISSVIYKSMLNDVLFVTVEEKYVYNNNVCKQVIYIHNLPFNH